MEIYKKRLISLEEKPKKWLITGVAGFIGSNLLETLLKLNQKVVGLDSFATGYAKNLDEVKSQVSPKQWKAFHFIEGDIRNLDDCRSVCRGVDYVLHQAALGSVPRSISDPIATNETNISGFLNILTAARDEGVKSFTYAASSSTYGDHLDLPKTEDVIGKPLSPYAITKYVNELYADNYSSTYHFHSSGLRYFNVFGKRQDPKGAYAAVIPKWIAAMIFGDDVFINGDGKTSRDFCFIDNVIQANILAATNKNLNQSEVFNVALGDRTSLNELFLGLEEALVANNLIFKGNVIFKDFRPGDVRHSQADINKAEKTLGYCPEIKVKEGIIKAMPWYLRNLGAL